LESNFLEISNINTFYGQIQALWGVTANIKEAEIVALIGANGAGKSTLLNTISGIIRPVSGSITFMGKKVSGIPAHQIVEMGLAHIPEGGRAFPEMSVLENLEMGAYPERAWKYKSETLKYVFRLFPRLKERENQLARTLSGGEKQMLAMGRGLMSKPKMVMLDEPSYGLAPIIVLEVFRIIKTLRDNGITVLIIEQNVKRTLEIADRAYILENGKITLEGPSIKMMENDHVRQAFLGI
jgi:branched-chain amino acid transport system ATP-binding protein